MNSDSDLANLKRADRAEAGLIGIVDDDEALRESLSSFVRSIGFRAAVFPSAEAFLTSGQTRDPDCLILDVRMPGMTGLDLQSRMSGIGCRVPIIFVTAHFDDKVRTQAIAQGAIAFLAKPFTDEALLSAMHSALL